MNQDLRSFIGDYQRAFPGEVVRVTDPVGLEHDVMAVVLEYERRRRWPILLFEHVRGHTIPIVANVVASRQAQAVALGGAPRVQAPHYAPRNKDRKNPRRTGNQPDPMALHFPNEIDGALGVKFVEAAMASSAAGGAWTSAHLEL